MLKNILITHIYTENDNLPKDWQSDVLPARIIVSEEDADALDTLVVSSDGELLARYAKHGFAILGVSDGDTYFDGLKYVTYDVEDCDYDYLFEIFCRQKNIPMKILETERTVVREMTTEDLPELYDLYDDELVRKYVENLYDYEQEKEYLIKYIEGMYCFYGYGMWAVLNRQGKLIGKIGISNRNIDGVMCTELGYIVHRDYRGIGIAKEVCNAILKYAAEKLKLKDMYIIVEPDNERSVKTALSLGFVEENSVKIDNVVHNKYYLRLG